MLVLLCLVTKSFLHSTILSDLCLLGYLMVFNATFNNMSAILRRSILLVEKTIDLSQVTDKLYHSVVHLALIEIRAHNISGDRH